MAEEKKKRNIPPPKQRRVPFKSDEALVEHCMKILVKSGMTPEQIDIIRNKNYDMYSKEMIGQRRYATSMLLAANLSNEQIAKVFKLSKETVASDREHLRKIYSESILQNADHWRAKLLKEQEEIKAKAMKGFEASKQKIVRKIQQRNGDEIVTTEVYETAGESSFLTVAKGCLEQQAKILGLFDKKPEVKDDDKSYKKFLNNLSSEVKKIREAEKNAGDRASAIDAEATFDDDGNLDGDSRPMLPANPEENQDDA
jgi:transposase